MKISKLGTAFVFGYSLLSLIAYVAMQFCKSIDCLPIVVLPTFPWIFLFEHVLPNSVVSWVIEIVFNAFLFYILGAMIEKKYK